MILAYHRVSSNRVLEAIMDAGRIIPAAYRLDPERIQGLCADMLRDASGPGMQGVLELVEEATAYFMEIQESFPGPKTRETALKCEDILSGDAGRIFLSPGTWSEAGRALGWPLSGFAFDAERLIELGARFRPKDLGSSYWSLFRRVLENSDSPADAKERILDGIRKIHEKGELSGRDAIKALEIFLLKPGEEGLTPDERRKYEWPSGTEMVWDDPLPIDLVVEIRKNDQILWIATRERIE